MSALEQALRQIEQDRQARKGSGSVRGVMPGIMLDSLGKPKQSRRGLLFAVVALSLACGGTWLMMLGFLPVGPEDLSRWGRSIPSVSALFTRTKKMSPQVQTTDEPSVSDATPAASAQPPKGSASLPITVSASAASLW